MLSKSRLEEIKGYASYMEQINMRGGSMPMMIKPLTVLELVTSLEQCKWWLEKIACPYKAPEVRWQLANEALKELFGDTSAEPATREKE